MNHYRNRYRRIVRRKKGMTLTEIMIVVIIIALISATAVGVYINRMRAAEDETARTDSRRVADTVMQYLVENRGAECPSAEELVEAGYLSQRGRTTDPWGHEWTIDCSGDEPVVTSPGRDEADPEDDVSSMAND